MEKMSRQDKIDVFLKKNLGSLQYNVKPIAGDASSRQYYRVFYADGGSAVLMDDNTQNSKIDAFLKIDTLLAKAGIHVPHVYAKDLDEKFLLLEDLGEKDLSFYLGGEQETSLLKASVDILLKIYHNVKNFENIRNMDDAFILKDFCLFLDWYMPCVLKQDLSKQIREEFLELITSLLPMAHKIPESLVLWDYHANNILVNDGCCGIIDFQDALKGPSLYDLVSLLEDERRFIDKSTRQTFKDYFYSNIDGIARNDFEQAYAFMALLRHMRVIGRFTTLITVSNKPQYGKYVARAWELLEETLNYSEFSQLKKWLDKYLPSEKRIVPQKSDVSEAFVLAAGRGTRMKYLTDDKPKPLVEVGGKALIDYNFDKLLESGIQKAIVNLCYKGEMIYEHLQQQKDIQISYSWEDEALETGGGIKNALHMIEKDAFLVMNSDTFWFDKGFKSALRRMMDAWNPQKYDILLLFHSMKDILGDNNQGIGNYKCLSDGTLERNVDKKEGYPYWFTGVSIVHKRVFDGIIEKKFSLRDLFDVAQKNKRLGFVKNEGVLFHVGTPEAVCEAEKWLKKNIR